jgi:hypothetical protein
MFQVENLKCTVYLIMNHLYGSAIGIGDVLSRIQSWTLDGGECLN